MKTRTAFQSILVAAVSLLFAANVQAFTHQSMRIGTSSALAVQSMNISLDNHGVKIAWDVRNADDVVAFEIERAVLRNGNIQDVSWTTIKSFPVIEGHVIASTFEYYDLSAPAGSPVILYRIKQVSNVNDVLFSSAVKIQLLGTAGLKISSAYPNPVNVNSVSTVQYSVGTPQPVTVSALDVTGKEIAVLASGHHNQGEYSVDFSTANLTAGTYFIRLVSASTSSIQRLVVSR